MNGGCPKEIGDATVIAYAIVKPENAHTGNTKQIVAGETKGTATAMIIAQYKNDESFYVFGCYSQEWATETDTWHQDIVHKTIDNYYSTIKFFYKLLI
jgi:hypothetical protein